MEDRVLARSNSPERPLNFSERPQIGLGIDLVAAERVTASVDRLLAAVPQDPSPVAVRRWLLAAERLLALSGEFDRARLLQAAWALMAGPVGTAPPSALPARCR
jgi:hypothetical protein